MMRLKRLVCDGFKSFADRTEFVFDASLTGIIGPNGCGKSNVVDALKWVLGDQRASNLRGKEMTDVIFKGSQGREAMHRAEVEIVLEEDASGGPIEISVGRRLTSDKESHYLLNGEAVRLKDIRRALLDTGLGVGAYSVMEQGKIDAVLSANPEERRAIFEEAAGISRFKLQKRETLRRLDRTEQNLARIKDLVEERGKRIRSLKLQASKARRFKRVRDGLRELKAAIAVVEARGLRAERDAQAAILAERQATLQELEGEKKRLQAIVLELEAEIERRSAALEALSLEIQQAHDRHDAALGRAQAQEQRADELARDAAAAVLQRRQVFEQQTAKQAAIEAEGRRLKAREEEAVQLEADLRQHDAGLSKLQEEVSSLQERRELARARLLEAIHRETLARNRVHEEEAQLRALAARGERIGGRLAALATQRDEWLEERRALQEKLTALRARVAECTAAQQTSRSSLEAADREVAGFSRQQAQLRESLSATEGRLEILLQMEAHHEGLDRGPRWLLEARPEGLRGRLVDQIEVDLGHGAAVEAALGPFVQALLVDTRAHADAMLLQLTSEQRGRALLLVAEEFEAGPPASPPMPLPPRAEALSRHVGCAEDLRKIVDWLLRGVCLVPSLAHARADRHDLCFVTTEGGLVCGPRLEGGRGQQQGGLVMRRARIRALQEERESSSAKLERLLVSEGALADRVSVLKAELQQMASELAGLRHREQEVIAQDGRLEGRLTDLRCEGESLELERGELGAQRVTALARLGTHLLDLHLSQRCEASETEAEKMAASAHEAVQARLPQARHAAQELRLTQVACDRDRHALRDRIQMHEQALLDLQQTARELQAGAAKAEQAAEAARGESARCLEEAASEERRVTARSEQRGRAERELAGVTERRDRARQAIVQVEERYVACNEEVTSSRLSLSELDHRFARCEERLREETTIELRRCLGEVRGFGLVERRPIGPPAPALLPVLPGPPLPRLMLEAELGLTRLWEREACDVEEARRQAQVLQSRLDRIGNVNLDAVIELEEMQASYDSMVMQVEDLIESRLHLIETLRQIESESRSKFEATFAEARGYFRSIFRKLFQGGRADMFLEEGADSLEAGIEIMTRPPGKELQSIRLLSGGERSLTALAILFAVFKVKPSPFCILDEVDAALDEANVERFLHVLEDFVGPTQFCVVTHHKRTMAACQVLYGITMQRRGISSRIAVSLDQADGFAKRGNGTPARAAGAETGTA